MRPDNLAVALLLTALVAFGAISTDLYLPSLPAIARAFATDSAEVQLTLSVFRRVSPPARWSMGRCPTVAAVARS